MGRIIAIVGTGPTAGRVNREPATTEVWCINKAWAITDRGDRWFHMDATPDQTENQAFLHEFAGPVYLSYLDEVIPTGIEYPLDTVRDKLGGYFRPTASYALALALYEGVDAIHLWGLDYPLGSEYEAARPCVEYWIGRAHGMGISVQIPIESTLLTVVDSTLDMWRRQAGHLYQLDPGLAPSEQDRLRAEATLVDRGPRVEAIS